MTPVRPTDPTPRLVRALDAHDRLLQEIPPPRPPARPAEEHRPAGVVPGTRLPLLRLDHGRAGNPPSSTAGTRHTVSRLVANACPDRDDLLVPALVVRDAHGNPTGCRALARGLSASPGPAPEA